MIKQSCDVVTIGSAVRDTLLLTPGVQIITQNKLFGGKKLFAFEYGAKYSVQDAFVGNGGGGCNTAVNFSRLGASVTVLTVVGKDDVGDGIIKDLAKEKIDISHIKRVSGYTGFSTVIARADDKEREHVILHYDKVSKSLRVTLPVLKKISPRIVYLASIRSDSWESTVKSIVSYKKARKSENKDVLWVWNPGQKQLEDLHTIRLYLKDSDILFLNRREAFQLADRVFSDSMNSLQSVMIDIFSFGSRLVIVTDGIHGSYSYDGVSLLHARIYDLVETVDTTGVGDAFGSTFTFAYDKYSGDINRALRLASINAAFVSSVIGAQHGALSLNEIIRLV